MDKIMLWNLNTYQQFLKDIEPLTQRIVITVLDGDPFVTEEFIKNLEDIVKSNAADASKRRGKGNSVIYSFSTKSDNFKFLYRLKNIFIPVRKFICTENYRSMKTYRLELKTTELGLCNIAFIDIDGEDIVASETHELDLFSNIKKYPVFTKYVWIEPDNEQTIM